MDSDDGGSQPFSDVGINTDNTAQRLPLVLVLDRSDSMRQTGEIDDLNAALPGIEAFFTSPETDPKVRMSVEIAIVSFGSDVRVHDVRRGGAATVEAGPGAFVEAHEFRAPYLTATGMTPMGGAMRTAMQIADARVRELRSRGLTSKQPFVWLISDGEPNDAGWEAAAREAIEWSEKKRGQVRAIATGDHERAKPALSRFTNKPVPRLIEARWNELIEFISRVSSNVAMEQPGAEAASGGAGSSEPNASQTAQVAQQVASFLDFG